MIWQKDKLRPTQPYFVFDTLSFRQEIYLKQGISHFYEYHAAPGKPLRAVPDGCIDIVFEYNSDGMRAYVRGTCLEYLEKEWDGRSEVFGVRFMPGINPAILNVTMKEVIETEIPVSLVARGDLDWLDKIAVEKDFFQRIRIFIEAYTKVFNKKEKPFGKKELIQSVKNMVYDSDGKVKVNEMQENTGYSERYINKVFIEEMGFSPKTFCKIIQFQRAIEFLNYGAPDKMTDAAVFLGYYDQSQFIKDFTRYAGTTPKKYLKMVQSEHYKERVITN